jgi:hypothetical protein
VLRNHEGRDLRFVVAAPGIRPDVEVLVTRPESDPDRSRRGRGHRHASTVQLHDGHDARSRREVQAWHCSYSSLAGI